MKLLLMSSLKSNWLGYNEEIVSCHLAVAELFQVSEA
jgi:hypothetical protein